MARHKTPTNVLEASGAFKKNPNRGRPKEPKVTKKLGKPPYTLSDSQLKAWKEIVTQAPGGVLTFADRINVEMASGLLAEYRMTQTDFSAAKMSRLQSILATFGMSPADRSRVEVEPEKEKGNEFGL